jgi:hypothetical protein
MARILETTTWNLPHSIERAFPKPLDSTEIWYPTVIEVDNVKTIGTTALNNAIAYAQSTVNTSYVGQTVCVLEGRLVNGVLMYNGIKPEYYSIQLNNSGVGELVPLFDESLITKIANNQYETLEINYENGLIYNKEEGCSIILAPGSGIFRQATSTLFINGLQSNRSEYYEGWYEDGKFMAEARDYKITNELGKEETIRVCNAIKFDKFELSKGDVFGDSRANNGDEVIMNAMFIESKKE